MCHLSILFCSWSGLFLNRLNHQSMVYIDNCVFEIYALIYHTFINNIKQYILILFQNFVFLLKTFLTEINVLI